MGQLCIEKQKICFCKQNKQGGSVLCVCTLSSDPAHLHFSLNCLTNEEEIKSNKSTYRSTNYSKSKTIYSRGSMGPVATIKGLPENTAIKIK